MTTHKRLLQIAALIPLLLMTSSCMRGGGFSPTAIAPMAPIGYHHGGLEAIHAANPLPEIDEPLEYVVEAAPLWETVDEGSQAWTQFAFQIVDQDGTALINGSRDMNTFCAGYDSATRNEKINFWVYLASAVAKYESDLDPASRLLETGLGTDPVTGEHVWSEGLLQLSYQDELQYPFCHFDWDTDKNLSPTDPKKSILQPDPNLSCGLQILNEQVAKRDLIAVNSGAYWSTLEPRSSHSALTSIRRLTQALPFCQAR